MSTTAPSTATSASPTTESAQTPFPREKKIFRRGKEYATKVQRDIITMQQNADKLWAYVNKRSARLDGVTAAISDLKVDLVFVHASTNQARSDAHAASQDAANEIKRLQTQILALNAKLVEDEKDIKIIGESLLLLVQMNKRLFSLFPDSKSTPFTNSMAGESTTQPPRSSSPPLSFDVIKPTDPVESGIESGPKRCGYCGFAHCDPLDSCPFKETSEDLSK